MVDAYETRLSRNRSGFVLVQLVVAVAIMVMLAAAVTPSMVNYLDGLRVDRAVAALEALNASVASYRADVGRYPPYLNYLVRPLVSGDVNACGSTLTNPQRGGWAGPYVSRLIPAGGLPLFVGLASDTLLRDPPSGNNNSSAVLSLRIRGARLLDAEALDSRLESTSGAIGSTNGLIRWTAAADGEVDITANLDIVGC